MNGQTDIFGRSFGDGSNRWIPGAVETIKNPVDRATNPYDTVAGAADAAALNFDEGVGGLVSLIDDKPGNTAGPGTSNDGPDSNVFNQDVTAGGAAFAGIGGVVLLAGLAIAFGQLFTVKV